MSISLSWGRGKEQPTYHKRIKHDLGARFKATRYYRIRIGFKAPKFSYACTTATPPMDGIHYCDILPRRWPRSCNAHANTHKLRTKPPHESACGPNDCLPRLFLPPNMWSRCRNSVRSAPVPGRCGSVGRSSVRSSPKPLCCVRVGVFMLVH